MQQRAGVAGRAAVPCRQQGTASGSSRQAWLAELKVGQPGAPGSQRKRCCNCASMLSHVTGFRWTHRMQLAGQAASCSIAALCCFRHGRHLLHGGRRQQPDVASSWAVAQPGSLQGIFCAYSRQQPMHLYD